MDTGIRSRTYKSWESMKGRCLNPNNHNFEYYGGRGIVVCEKWLEYKGFLEDMGVRPEYTTLGRINNNGHYCKENCRWETIEEQNSNKGLFKKNKTGIPGVRWEPSRNSWLVRGGPKYLYQGTDFFKACCARKAWERDNRCK